MKYLIMFYNDHDEEWTFLGVRDTYEEAQMRAASYESINADPPLDLGFTPRLNDPLDILANIPTAWSGYDHYFIFPCNDASDKPSAWIKPNE